MNKNQPIAVGPPSQDSEILTLLDRLGSSINMLRDSCNELEERIGPVLSNAEELASTHEPCDVGCALSDELSSKIAQTETILVNVNATINRLRL